MTREIAELDVVEVTVHQRCGLLEGARGTVVDIHTTFATLELIDSSDGSTIGLFEVPLSDLRRVEPLVAGANLARED
jgi:hypothetical protein